LCLRVPTRPTRLCCSLIEAIYLFASPPPLLFCDSEFNCIVKMSERVKDCPMGRSEKNKWKHLSLSVAQREELVQKPEHGDCVRLRTEDYLVAATIVSDLQKQTSVILVNDQLDAQFFFRMCLFQISTCFEHSCAHHQEN
jgi:hypothetical protein